MATRLPIKPAPHLRDELTTQKIMLLVMAALVPRPDVGTMRETFFLNQLRAAGHDATCPSRGDFLVDGRVLVEVGGAGKTFGQIAGAPNSYLAVDDVEVGRGNRIPLWAFGLLY